MSVRGLFGWAALLAALTLTLSAAEPATTSFKFYGYVGNEFFYNSRQNVEMVDGAIMLFPKPVSPNAAGADVSAIPQAEMLSVNSRLGLDINGEPILGAKSSGKIEADFAGTGATFFVLRLRQAYVKLNWDKTLSPKTAINFPLGLQELCRRREPVELVR